MNRALPLLILTAAIGGGLAFFALKTSPTGPAQEQTEDPIAMSEEAAAPKEVKPSKSASSDDLEDVTNAPRLVTAAPGGRAKAWEVIPINSVGQRIDGAVIKAVPTAEVGGGIPPLEGVGRIKWEDVPSGVWKLTVSSDDAPTWRRDIEIPSGKTTRTPVAMGPEIRITGVVRDSNGAPLSTKTPIFLLAKNAIHPTLTQRRAGPKSPKNGLPEGVIAAQTDGKGRFQARLPSAGEYRISVGDIRSADDARWTQKKAFELTYGGPDHIVATVPARPELTIQIPGPKEDRPTAVATYIYDAERAAQMTRTVERSGNAPPKRTLEEAQKAAKLEALGYSDGGKNGGGQGGRAGARRNAAGRGGMGTARTMSEENRRMQAQDFDEQENSRRRIDRSPVFEPGWRSIGSRPVDTNGEAIFTDLPEQVDLRFLFVRGGERISTQAPIRMRAQQRGLGAATLPPPSSEEGRSTSNLASVRVTDRPEDPDAPVLAEGVVWSIGKR